MGSWQGGPEFTPLALGYSCSFMIIRILCRGLSRPGGVINHPLGTFSCGRAEAKPDEGRGGRDTTQAAWVEFRV